MLSKDSKIRVLENFYALDYVFFGKPVNQVDMCCPLVKEEYLSVKGALMSVYVEMLKLVQHSPKAIEEKVDSKSLMGFARKSAKIARENSQKIVTSNKARANIKENLKEALKEDAKADVSAIVERAIRTKAFSLAVDNLLVARSLKESKEFNKLNEWEGQIIEDSYKILRDNLIEAAYMILYDEDEVELTEAEQRVEELHSPEIMTEMFEFLGFLNAVGSQLQATYNTCASTKCHKSSGGTSNPFKKAGRSCSDMCWVAALKKGISTLNSGKSRCQSAKNPEKCVARFDKLIARYHKMIKHYSEKAKKRMAKK